MRYNPLHIVAAVVVGLVAGNFIDTTGTIVPYRDVTLVSKVVKDTTVELKYNFYKNGCTLLRFEVLGYSDKSGWTFLNYSDLNNVEKGTDRLKGPQTLYISVEKDGISTSLELRTRHSCSGYEVDKVFSTEIL